MVIPRILLFALVLTALSLPLAAQVATPPSSPVSVQPGLRKAIEKNVQIGVGKQPSFATVPVAIPASTWYEALWQYAKSHPTALVPLVFILLGFLSDHDDLLALLFLGSAVALIVWGISALWASRNEGWFLWIATVVLIALALGVHKLHTSSPKAAGIIELVIGLVGVPVAVLTLKDKGVIGLVPAVGASLALARGLTKVRAAPEQPASPATGSRSPAAEPEPPSPSRKRSRSKKAPRS